MVADLVMINMVMLPDAIPAQFQSTYTPIAQAGTDAQRKHLARLISAQVTAKGLGPGVEQMKLKEQEYLGAADAMEISIQPQQKPKQILHLNRKQTAPALPLPPTASSAANLGSKKEEKKSVVFIPSGTPSGQKVSRKLHQFGLLHITQPLNQGTLRTMSLMAFDRILKSEKQAVQGGAHDQFIQIVISIVSQYGFTELQQKLMDYIFADQKSRGDLAILWLYRRYCAYQGFHDSLNQDPDLELEKYNDVLANMLTNLYDRGDYKEQLFHRIVLEAPYVSPAAVALLRKACEDKMHGSYALDTLKQLVLDRPRQRGEFLSSLLEFATYEDPVIRESCFAIAEELFKNSATHNSVLWHMTMYLRYLLSPNPPRLLFRAEAGRPTINDHWEEATIRSCLYLYLRMLPIGSHKQMFNELAQVYVEASADIKRVILKMLEQPVRQIGMGSAELLAFLEDFPEGAETLVTRIVYLMTERKPPTKELVDRIRDLYEKRVSDVRFLVPVLAGLSKREIVEALPKLIKLNLNVVKEVLINRLLSGKNIETHAPPLKPHELLIALHEMESQMADMKSIVAACNILLARKDLYTQEILAGVIQQLSDQPTIPALLMRTMLQALNTYPKLLGFLMNVMDRLVVKQIWRQAAKVWEGFVKICERTMPQSYTILLHLPEAQLRNLFILAPTTREPLLKYVNSLTIQQQATIPAKVIDVIQTDPAKYAERFLKGDDAGSRSGSEERESGSIDRIGAGEKFE